MNISHILNQKVPIMCRLSVSGIIILASCLYLLQNTDWLSLGLLILCVLIKFILS